MSKYSEQDKLRAINYYLAVHSFREQNELLELTGVVLRNGSICIERTEWKE